MVVIGGEFRVAITTMSDTGAKLPSDELKEPQLIAVATQSDGD